jgi:hypothetical protein
LEGDRADFGKGGPDCEWLRECRLDVAIVGARIVEAGHGETSCFGTRVAGDRCRQRGADFRSPDRPQQRRLHARVALGRQRHVSTAGRRLRFPRTIDAECGVHRLGRERSQPCRASLVGRRPATDGDAATTGCADRGRVGSGWRRLGTIGGPIHEGVNVRRHDGHPASRGSISKVRSRAAPATGGTSP